MGEVKGLQWHPLGLSLQCGLVATLVSAYVLCSTHCSVQTAGPSSPALAGSLGGSAATGSHSPADPL